MIRRTAVTSATIEATAAARVRQPKVASPQFRLGDVVSEKVIAARSDSCWRKLQRLVDELGPDAELREREVFALEPGTRVAILTPGMLRVRVRVLSGRHAGRVGLVLPEDVQRLTVGSISELLARD